MWKVTVYIVSILVQIHYANMPMLYTAIFHVCKNDNFPIKKCYIFLIFAQKIDCEYPLAEFMF